MKVTEGDAGRRLDRWLDSHFPAVPFGTRQKLLRTGQIRVDGKRAKPDTRLEAGQEIRLPPSLLDKPDDKAARTTGLTDQQRQMLDESVLFSDASLVILNKPPGLAVQGGSGVRVHLDAMLRDWGGDADGRTLRLTHRLDRDTSGVLVLARGAMIAGKMTDLFREHKVRKTYHALVEGRPRQDRGTIDAPLRKASTDDGERMVVDAENGLPALTRWHVLKHKGASRTWLALEPEHGRTHQLRVHCAHIGLPIAGDGKYGVKTGERLHLHAYQVRFPHPLTGHPLKITAELPPHMAESWGQRS